LVLYFIINTQNPEPMPGLLMLKCEVDVLHNSYSQFKCFNNSGLNNGQSF